MVCLRLNNTVAEKRKAGNFVDNTRNKQTNARTFILIIERQRKNNNSNSILKDNSKKFCLRMKTNTQKDAT